MGKYVLRCGGVRDITGYPMSIQDAKKVLRKEGNECSGECANCPALMVISGGW